MSRLGPYLLLTCFALVGLHAHDAASAAPLRLPSAWVPASDDRTSEIDKYNRKLHELELKRARDLRKLEAEYLKLYARKKSPDLRKLQQQLDKFQRKRDKIEVKYKQKLEKLERERARRGLE